MIIREKESDVVKPNSALLSKCTMTFAYRPCKCETAPKKSLSD